MTEVFPSLEPLEIATGTPLGTPTRQPVTLPDVDPDVTMRQALRDAILPALQRVPCLVSFSGGRDSSAVLAMATHVARSEGLPPPVPMTLRFSAPRSQENDWQEATVRHLGLDDWPRVHIGDGMDVVGEAAAAVLRQFGPYVPCNLHFHVPIVEAARGGSLLTGVGGDEIFMHWSTRRDLATQLRTRRSREAAVAMAMSLSPRFAREALLRWRRPLRLPWLRPGAARELAQIWARRGAAHLPTYQEGVVDFLSGRTFELQDQCLPMIGRSAGVVVRHPLLDRRFLAAVANGVPPDGFPSRTAAMSGLVGDLLPLSAVRRSTKAVFTDVFWGPSARAFADRWDGTGVDADVVDPDVLREVWSQPLPKWRSWTLLQQAWLASETRPRPAQPARPPPGREQPTTGAG